MLKKINELFNIKYENEKEYVVLIYTNDSAHIICRTNNNNISSVSKNVEDCIYNAVRKLYERDMLCR